MLIQYVTGPINTNAYKKKKCLCYKIKRQGEHKKAYLIWIIKKKKFTKAEKNPIMKYKKQWLSLGGVRTVGFSFFFCSFP